MKTIKDAKEIALVGNPNTGKTTIFNALTGLRHSTANYPGVTVEKKTGSMSGFRFPNWIRVTVVGREVLEQFVEGLAAELKSAL